MNLQLEPKGGVHVLKISGDVDVKGASILRTGITKLMKTGKNNIVLDLSQVGGLHESFVPEITELHKLASELLGKIIVTSAPAAMAEKINALSPPPFPLVANINEAINFLRQTGQIVDELPPEIQEMIKLRDARIQSLENQVALSNPEELRNLRRDNEALRETTRQLETKLTELVTERRIPPDIEAVLEKISLLERNMKEMSTSLQAGGQAGGHAKK